MSKKLIVKLKALSGLRQLLATENLLKMMKYAFCFIFKALFYSQNFLMNFWLCIKTGLIRNIMLISKLMGSQPGLQTIAIHTQWPRSHGVKVTSNEVWSGNR